METAQIMWVTFGIPKAAGMGTVQNLENKCHKCYTNFLVFTLLLD
jgi:hypothetical protein